MFRDPGSLRDFALLTHLKPALMSNVSDNKSINEYLIAFTL